MQESNDPAPCSIVDLAAGYVIQRIVGATQFLLMPTWISGIKPRCWRRMRTTGTGTAQC